MKRRVNLKTPDLEIKTLNAGHVTPEYVKGMNDREVNKYLVTAKRSRQTRNTIKGFVRSNLKSGNGLLLGIFEKDENRLIGTIRISDISHFHYLCSLGICIFDKRCWGKGYALQALQTVARFIFKDLKLHYIEAGVYEKNGASMKLFRRAGFREAAYFKDKYRHDNDFAGVYLFGLKNNDFKPGLLR